MTSETVQDCREGTIGRTTITTTSITIFTGPIFLWYLRHSPTFPTTTFGISTTEFDITTTTTSPPLESPLGVCLLTPTPLYLTVSQKLLRTVSPLHVHDSVVEVLRSYHKRVEFTGRTRTSYSVVRFRTQSSGSRPRDHGSRWNVNLSWSVTQSPSLQKRTSRTIGPSLHPPPSSASPPHSSFSLSSFSHFSSFFLLLLLFLYVPHLLLFPLLLSRLFLFRSSSLLFLLFLPLPFLPLLLSPSPSSLPSSFLSVSLFSSFLSPLSPPVSSVLSFSYFLSCFPVAGTLGGVPRAPSRLFTRTTTPVLEPFNPTRLPGKDPSAIREESTTR